MLLDTLDANDKYLIRLFLQIIMVYHGVTKMWYVDSTEVMSENMPFDKFEQIVKKVGLKLTRDNRFTNAHYIVSAKKVLQMQDLHEMKKRLYAYWQIYKRIYMAFGAVQLFHDRDENSTRFSVRLGLLESAFFSLLEKVMSFL